MQDRSSFRLADPISSPTVMSSQQRSGLLEWTKARRAANNNYLKQTNTLYEKLTRLCIKYDANIYFLAYRNGRFNGFASTDEPGQPWSPPGREALVRPSPFAKSQS